MKIYFLENISTLLLIVSCFSCGQNLPADNLQTLAEGTDMDEAWEEGMLSAKDTVKAKEGKERTEQMLRAAREALDFEEVTLDPEKEGQKTRVLVMRYDLPSVPVVLEVAEPTDAGTMSEISVFYFLQGELYAVDQSSAHYLFDDNTLQLWTDENWKPLTGIQTEQWLDRASELLRQVQIYLSHFDIDYE